MQALFPRFLFLALAAVFCVSTPARAQNDVPWLASVDLDAAAYDAQIAANAAAGYRPVSINGRNTSGGLRFEVVWHHDAVTDFQHQRGLTRAQAQTWVADRALQGYSPNVVSAYTGGASELYAVTACRDGGDRIVSWNLTSGGLSTDLNQKASQGYYAVWITTWVNSGSLRHGIVYARMASGAWALFVGQTASSLQTRNSGYHTQGFRALGLASDGSPSSSGFSGVWQYIPQPEGGYAEFIDQSRAEFDATRAQMAAQNMRPTIIAGYNSAPGVTRYHSAWVSQTDLFPRTWRVQGRPVPELAALDTSMQNYMTVNRVSAGQLAITYQGRLVFSRAYTWGRDDFTTTTLGNRFRTASVCKPEVATAIMQLVQEGRLSLDDRMIDHIGGMWADQRAQNIRIRDLLRHSGGWDRSISPDPMFLDQAIAATLGVPLPITREHIIQYQRTRALNHDPGTGWWYSNFGYMLLGKIVEQLTGMPYEQYCRQNVWENVGAQDGPRVTTHLPGEPNEPEYVDPTGGLWPSVYEPGVLAPYPYGAFNFENAVSVGSWACSARDLARFCRAIEDLSRTNILTPASRDAMWSKPPYADPGPDAYYYGFGWAIYPGIGLIAGHAGDLIGSHSEIGILVGETTYSAVANVDAAYVGGDNFFHYFISEALAQVTSWPDGDLWCKADFDLDGFVDFFDVDGFVGCFESGDCPDGADADFNEDGFVDFFDIDAYVAAYETGC